MKNLQEIARRVRRPEDQLRFPTELLLQGYEPNYLANYRPDELGNIDEPTLSTLKRTIKQFDAMEAHRAKVLATLDKDPASSEAPNSAIVEIVQNATSIAEIDTTLRHVRARKNARSIADKNPAAQAVGQAILTMQGEAPADLNAWIAETASIPAEQVEEVLAQTKLWLTHMLSEDLRLMRELQQYVLRKGVASVKILPEPPKGSDAEKQLEASEDAGTIPAPETAVNDTAVTDTTAAQHDSAEDVATTATTEDTADNAEPTSVSSDLSPSDDAEVAPLIADFNQGKKASKPIKTKSLSEKQLSPRQRRRRWLRSILESYARLKKPVGNITPYQILMLARGLRSQIIQLNIDYDKKPLVQMCREALCPGRHPMHSFLLEVSESALHTFLLPRVHQDVMAILEEYANEELTEAAVSHLQTSLLQRPIRGHRILVIDAIGPKMAAAAIIDSDGNIVFTGELPCNSNRPDIVNQNVVTLGTWVHEHRVTLISLSNGPARRYLMQPIAELLRQSGEGSLYWTMVDRAGADGYCNSRICLVELPNISRRHRAAVWLARRLQDPLQQILKVDPSRLRLGSYQRELPQAELELALRDAVSSAISRSGLDIFSTEPEVLQRAPGMTLAAAKAVAQACREEKITNRESLLAVLNEHLTENQARQAIGFLRVYGSNVALDSTSIHPDDYRLAERLIEHANLPVPPNAPEGWIKPDYQALAAVNAAAEEAFAKQQAEFGASLMEDSSEEHAENEEGENASGETTESLDSTTESATESSSSELTAAPESNTESAPAVDSAPEGNASSAVESTSAEATDSPEASVTTTEVSSDGSAESSESPSPTATETVSEAATSSSASAQTALPPQETTPRTRPTLAIDVERLARSWQVGREKMRRVANSLQTPFEDDREYQFPVPLISKLPRLDSLKPGDMLQALVVGVTDFGVFVDLGPECSGLIHISRITPNYVEDPHQYVQMGDLLTVWVINIDEKRKRVALTAIAPGTQARREGADRSNDQRGGNDQRSDNRSGERRGGDRRPQGRAGEGSGERGAPSGARGGNRNDRGGNRGPGSGSRGGNDRNRGDRGRGRDQQSDSAPRRPTRVGPPREVKPITDAMQEGREPMRSFSDLLQFMKKPKSESDIVPEGTSAPNQSESNDTTNSSGSDN